MKHGKKYIDSKKLIDPLKYYEPAEAIELVKQTGKAKFDETVELSIRLGVDPRHADQQVRGAVVLPHGTGKTVRVLVFAKGPKAEEAKAAGADCRRGLRGRDGHGGKDPEGKLVRFRCLRCHS